MVNPYIARTRDYAYLKPRRHRVKFSLREKACYIKLAHLGYSQNIIAKLFHRSTSVVNHVLQHHIWSIPDLRKIPRAVREKAAQIQYSRLLREGSRWLDFALGLEDRPP